jgi:hypothetical protein
MKAHVRAVVIVLLAALVSSCAKTGSTPAARGTAGPGASAPAATGASPGAAPTGAAAQTVVDEHWPHEVSSGDDHVTAIVAAVVLAAWTLHVIDNRPRTHNASLGDLASQSQP